MPRIEPLEPDETPQQSRQLTKNLATFTNYMNDFMGTEVDLPAQKPRSGRTT